MGIRGESIRNQASAGLVEGMILASVAERHWLCRCSWSYDYPSGKMRLHYMNMACPSGVWHRRLEKEQND